MTLSVFPESQLLAGNNSTCMLDQGTLAWLTSEVPAYPRPTCWLCCSGGGAGLASQILSLRGASTTWLDVACLSPVGDGN